MSATSLPSFLKSFPPGRPVPLDYWSNLSVGLVDVWPPLMGFCSSHCVYCPPGQTVGVVCHLLVWVACLIHPDVISACCVVQHMLIQCPSPPLAFVPWCSVVPWTSSIRFQRRFQPSSCPWISCSYLFSPPWSVVICYRASPFKAGGQRPRPPEGSSVDFAL